MRVVWTPEAWDDYTSWQEGKKKDPAQVKRINKLIRDIKRNPHVINGGLGKPEKLVGAFAGLSSRRIDQEHRLIYDIDGDDLIIYSAREHY